MKKVKKVKGFVMNRKTGHASYAFKQKGVDVESLGFTHNEEDIAEKEKLRHNIDAKDNRACYVKTKIEKQRYNTYREKEDYKDYRFHPEDRELVQGLMKGNKKRR